MKPRDASARAVSDCDGHQAAGQVVAEERLQALAAESRSRGRLQRRRARCA